MKIEKITAHKFKEDANIYILIHTAEHLPAAIDARLDVEITDGGRVLSAEIYAVRKWGLFELAGFFEDPDGPGQDLLEAVAAPFVDVFPRALEYMQISIPPTDPRARALVEYAGLTHPRISRKKTI